MKPIKPAPIVAVEAQTLVYHAKEGRRWQGRMRTRRAFKFALQTYVVVAANAAQHPGYDQAIFPGWA